MKTGTAFFLVVGVALKKGTDCRKIISYLSALVMIMACICIETFICPKPFYTNDQVLMRDIASGVYTGTPDGHLVYILYPLGFLLSFLYRIVRIVPWYDIFMWITLPVCSGIITYKVMSSVKNLLAGIVISFVSVASLSSIFCFFIVQNEYTVNAGIWGLTGLFCIILASVENCRQNVWAFISLTIALWLRKEIFLMLVPFLIVIFLWKYFSTKNKKVFCSLAVLAGIALASVAIDKIAYSSKEWRDFRQYNEYRTQIVDYYGMPAYSEVASQMVEAGITEAEYNLFSNCIGWNDDYDKLKTIAKLSKELHDANENISDVKTNLIYQIKLQYVAVKRSILGIMTVVTGVSVLAIALILSIRRRSIKELGILVPVAALGMYVIVFTVYFIYRGRFPERISLPLYAAYLFTVIGYLSVLCNNVLSKGNGKCVERIAAFLTMLILLCGDVFGICRYLPSQIQIIEDNHNFWNGWILRTAEIEEYANEHSDTVFYIDGSAGNYKCDYMLENRYSTGGNTLNLGFWTYGSPLQKKRKEGLGITEPVLSVKNGNVQWITSSEFDIERVSEYYLEEMGINIELVDRIEGQYGNENVYAFR